MNSQDLPPKYLSRYEAASHLRVSSRTIDRLIRDNRIRAFKLGKRVLIHYDSLTEENINAVRPKLIILKQIQKDVGESLRMMKS